MKVKTLRMPEKLEKILEEKQRKSVAHSAQK